MHIESWKKHRVRNSVYGYFRLTAEDGFSFNQISSAFGHMGYKAKSHNSVSNDVGEYIKTLKEESQAEFKAAFDK